MGVTVEKNGFRPAFSTGAEKQGETLATGHYIDIPGIQGP
ncbi:hypothetical protein MIZ03_4589 [Rhodoferax lithotrophicus]|uniref:Uncharacterized protein n=1 Tax=Rhodoferax lithotrophicus TaxID=2798804 RepID=A0ABN6DCG0_9BURK|nr:hypothetical protein MIZ03_4589 [Rhodoferax sp. MIZ03]